jgi:hypothetical protein
VYDQQNVIGLRDPAWNVNSLLLQTLIAMKDCFDLEGPHNSIEILIRKVERMAEDAENPYSDLADEKEFPFEREHKGAREHKGERRASDASQIRGKGRERTGTLGDAEAAKKRLEMLKAKKGTGKKAKPRIGRPKSGLI